MTKWGRLWRNRQLRRIAKWWGIPSGVAAAAGLYGTFCYRFRPEIEIRTEWYPGLEGRPDTIQTTLVQVTVAGQPLDSGQIGGLLILQVINVGKADLRVEDFDPEFPIRVKLSSGAIVASDLIEASNEYVHASASNRSLFNFSGHDNTMSFLPFNLEIGEWIRGKAFLIAERGVVPSLAVSGKIRGVRIKVVTQGAAGTPSIAARALGGGIWIQVLRLGVYGLGMVAVPVAVWLTRSHWTRLRMRAPPRAE